MKNIHSKPLIGVTMALDESGKIRAGASYALIRREYGSALKAAGAEPIFLDPNIDPEVAAKLCDGIVISGGEDIDPSIYGEPDRGTKLIEPMTRTLWERRLIDACDINEKPILGICYGQQLLNIHYGGTLYQDLASELSNHIDHGTSDLASMHEITFQTDGLGFAKGERAVSASRHHQAVKDLAPGFVAVAMAQDGIVEAIKGRGHFGIQWHPESDGTAARIYGAFIAECKKPHIVTIPSILGEESKSPLEA